MPSLSPSLIVSWSIDHHGLEQQHQQSAVSEGSFDTDLPGGRAGADQFARDGLTDFGLAISGLSEDQWALNILWNAKSRTYMTKCSIVSEREAGTRTGHNILV